MRKARRLRTLSRFAFAALLMGTDGCAFLQIAPAAEAATFREKVLYSFCSQQNCADGSGPAGALIDVNGTLYGTTAGGGAQGEGTVFAFNPSTGAETVLYSFCSQTNCADGANVIGGLIYVNGTLYGITASGGGTGCNGFGCGIVFSLDPNTGNETALYSFCGQLNCSDGANPTASLIAVNGILYGTTEAGGTGSCSCGTVFAFDLSTGVESVLHSFCSERNCADGGSPFAGLISYKGRLFGTTLEGGLPAGGTVFAIDRKTGAETVLYSFCQQINEWCEDGAEPVAGLIEKKGTLYGTTVSGGAYDGGTIFALDANTGARTMLYSFCSQKNCPDGRGPEGGLIALRDTLYGTTELGGTGTCSGLAGCGTVFSFDLSTGEQTVVHSFAGAPDGAVPSAGITALNGKLYGTTSEGGAQNDGAAFRLKERR